MLTGSPETDASQSARPDPAARRRYRTFGVTLRGLATFRNRRGHVEQYPEYKRPVYPRFRGRHRLQRHENGLEKCVGCSLCAAACPADCIRVVAAENTPEHRVSAGERYAADLRDQHGALHLLRLLRDRVPVRRDHARQRLRALRATTRDDLIYTKEMLLAPPVRADAGAGPEGRRWADTLDCVLACPLFADDAARPES